MKNIMTIIVAIMATAAQAQGNTTADTTATANEVYNLYQALVARPRNPFGSCTHATYDVKAGYVKSIEVTHCAGLEISIGGVMHSSSWKTDEGASGTSQQWGGGVNLRYVFAREGWCIAPFAEVEYSKLTNVDFENLKAPAMELKFGAGGRLFPHGRISIDLGGTYGYSRGTSQKTFVDGHTTTMAAPCRHLGVFVRPSFVICNIKSHKVAENINVTVKRPVRFFIEGGYSHAKVLRPDGEYTQEGRHFVEPSGWNKVNRFTVAAGLIFSL